MTALSVPPAGWYPDRGEANLLRWWDGQQWTDQTQSTAPAVSAFEEPVSVAAFGFVPQEQNTAEQNPAAQNPALQNPAAQNTAAQNTAAQNPAAQYTATQAPLIAPGWYPDNADPALQRWWDGTQWTPHTAPASPVMQGNGAGLYAPGIEPVSSANNNMATLSLLFSVLSIGGLFLIWLLPLSLAGIIIGIVALRRARRFAPSRRKRGQAIAGIIVGGISLVMTILLTVAAFLVYQQLHRTDVSQTGTQQSSPQTNGATGGDSAPSTVAELKQAIAHSVARNNSVAVTTVTCDAQASMASGSSFDCGAQAADGRWTTVRVDIGQAEASGMTYGLGFGPLVSADDTTSPATFTVAEIEREFGINLGQAWGADVSHSACDASASTTEGSTFRCTVDLADGRSGEILITMTPPYGYDVSVVRLPAGSGGTSGSDGTGSNDSSDPDVAHT